MSKNAIRISELVAVLILYEIGSTTLYLQGATALQDAWAAMMIGACGGFLLLLMYLWIFRLDPRRDLFELCVHYLGKIPGSFIGLLFVGYFAYEASRVTRDLSELTALTLLDRTPLFAIALMTMLVSYIVLKNGPKSVFLLTLMLLPIVAAGYIILLLLLLFSGRTQLEYMFPVLENGLMPVLKIAIPNSITFPFGQVVSLLVFFKLLDANRKQLNKTVMLTYGIVALILILVNQLNIVVLGPKLAAIFTYPLLEVVRLINIVRVFERLDVIFVLILFMGLGIKSVIFYTGAAIGFCRITSLKYKAAAVLSGIIIFAFSLFPGSFTEYIWIGLNFTVVWIWPIFQFVLPLLLLLMMLIRKKKRQQQPEDAVPAEAERA
ncbi:GerAB/ArcD/ProY family transporter [Paenibacillus jiagnxiensis]|uniref:GerAB/ArcD/ProY family transporter n=1 Tax=Paenibacillus jiagnxiensis TaxID=3228926 RepID=UPI0033BF62A2